MGADSFAVARGTNRGRLGVVGVCLREGSPQSRYLAACLAKTCQLVFLIGTLLLVTGSPARISSTNLISESASPGQASISHVEANTGIAAAVPLPSRTVTQPESLSRRFFEPLNPAIPWIGFMWCCGFLAVSFWNLGGLVVLYRLKTAATSSVDRVLDSTLARLLIRMQVGRRIRLLQSACAESPFVIGVLRPVIVFPTSLLTQLSPEQIEAILIHELAHIRRHDYLVNLFQVVIDTILFYHPATWWISTRIRSERENCCDDIVIKTTAERDIYIAALAVIAESRTSLAPAAAGAPLLHRIRRLLGVSDHRGQFSFVSIILVLILLVAGITFSSQRLAAQATDQTKTRTVVVWKVGPIRYNGYPEPDVVPDELVTRSAEPNIQLKIKVLPREESNKEVVSAYAKAKATGNQPDILSSYDFQLLGSLPDGKNGCEVEGSLETLAPVSIINLFPSSPNFLAAKELALSYPTNEEAPKGMDPALEKAVLDFAKAHCEGDVARTTQLLDPAVQKDFQGNLFSFQHSRGPYPVETKKKICSVWQGEHIAIVQTMAFSERPNYIGCDTVTSIFEGKRGDWKLVDYVAQDLGSDLVRDLTKRIGPSSGKKPGHTQEPVLINPADGSSFGRNTSPNDFPPKLEWRHDDENVEAYLVELQIDGQPGVGHSGKGTWCTFPIQVVRPTTKGQILSWAGPGRGVPPHRWRVWAIYGDGSVSISGWKTFYYDW